MSSKLADYDFSDPENNAPEAVERSSDLIPAAHLVQHHMGSSKVPQQYATTNGYASDHASQAPETAHSSESEQLYGHDKNGILLGNAELGAARDSSRAKRRRPWIWIISAAIALLLLAVGLGAGLGVGLSSSSNDSEQTQPTTTSTSATTPTSTSSATPSAVTSGTTGVAAFSCGSQQTTSSTNGTGFTQECYTQYTTGRASYYHATDNVTTQNLGGKYTTYNLTACLDSCDQYNLAGGSPPCRAVTYYANLSAPIQMWGGNCFLKNDRGTDAHADAIDWTHTMSAFMSCLNVTCHGSN